MQKRKKLEKKDEEEIMDYLRSVLRGDPDGEGRTADTKTRLKAAELLAKRYGLLAEKKETPDTELKVVFDYGEKDTENGNEDRNSTV